MPFAKSETAKRPTGSRTHRIALEVEKLPRNEVYKIMAERNDCSVAEAKRSWKMTMDVIREVLLSGNTITIDGIGRIVMAQSKKKVWGNGKEVGGNIIPKIEFSHEFRMAMRNVDLDS